MHTVIKVLYSIMILVKNFVESKDIKVYSPMIVGAKDGKVSVISQKADDINPNITVLNNFENRITSFARHKNYLFISTESTIFRRSKIYRCIFSLTNIYFFPGSCQIFYTVPIFFFHRKHVSSMVVGNDTLFSGYDDGGIWRCSTTEENNCEYLNKAGSEITGIDYDHVSHLVYASTARGTLLRCSPITPDSCVNIYRSCRVNKFTSVKIAYDAVWLGVLLSDNKGVQLLKCPIKKINDGEKCGVYYHFLKQNDTTCVINASDGYLFFKIGEMVWKLKPQGSDRLLKIFQIPWDIETLVFF